MRQLLLLLFVFTLNFGWAQKSNLVHSEIPNLTADDRVVMPRLDNEQLRNQELASRAPGTAKKFAEPIAVDINPNTHGRWDESGDLAIWRLQLTSETALSINLGFTQYYMPEGGKFIVHNLKGTQVQGPFTPSDNEIHNQLWTPVFHHDDIVLQVSLPKEKKEELKLQLSYVNHDFVGFGREASGSCNLDVNCSEADGWGIVDGYRDIIRSVAIIGVNGNLGCTGFLINNANYDGKAYFMTAAHCGIDLNASASLVIYWNFEQSECRQPNSAASGANGNGTLDVFNSGSVFKAANNASDFTLVELDDPIHPEANAFMAGFSLEQTPPSDTVIAVHHPSTDEKRISFEFDPTYLGDWGSGDAMNPDGDHIIVPDWDIGTTEPGSSGSPLFDKNRRVVGQLHGGGAACGNDLYDSYGWFYASWTGGGSEGTRLSDFLDPNNTGVTTIDGLDLSYNIVLDQSSSTFCIPDDQTFQLTISENYETNVSLSLTPAPPAGVDYAFSNNNPAGGEVVTLTFTNTENFGAGNFSFTIDAMDGGTNSSFTVLSLNTYEGTAAAPTLSQPADNLIDVVTNTVYSWDPVDNADLYDLQIATDENFTNVVSTITDIEGTTATAINLDVVTTYYWRVRAVNVCGTGNWSNAYSFITANILCGSNPYTGEAVAIEDEGTFSAVQNISTDGIISQVVVNDLNIVHSYIGDLRITLVSPSGTSVVLVDRIGYTGSGFGCGSANFTDLAFDDFAMATAQDLEETCDGGPAATGLYQPVDALSAFNGEMASGEWTLIVDDEAGGDGGEIASFSIDICSTIPDNTNLSPQENNLESCQAETTSFSLYVGTAYDSDVTLSATGFPAEANVMIAPNPAAPGSNVTVTVENLDAAIGNYTVSFNGTDGVASGEGSMVYTISDGPAAVNVSYPEDAEFDVPESLTFTWDAAQFANSYRIIVTDQSNPGVPVIDEVVMETSYSGTLEQATDYSWQVTAIGSCGETVSESSDFKTIGNLAFSFNTTSQIVCLNTQSTASISIGNGFFEPSVVEYTVTPEADFGFVFNQDLNAVSPDADLEIEINVPLDLVTGIYTALFTIDDGVHNSQSQIVFSVISAPQSFSLASPSNGEVGTSVTPALDWTVAIYANSYEIEIATDADFNNIVQTQTASTSAFDVTDDLDANTTYYWRVKASGQCGDLLSEVYSFTTATTGVNYVGDIQIDINPNPVSDLLRVELSKSLSTDTAIRLYHADGRLISSNIVAIGRTNLDLPFGSLSSGIYFVDLVIDGKRITERIIKI